MEQQPVKMPENFCLEKFVNTYVSLSFVKAKENPKMDDFDDYVRHEVSVKLGIDESIVKNLHHVFHWKFFNSNNNSIFEYRHTMSGEVFIGLKRDYTPEDITEISKSILCEKVLENKIRAIFN